jgi:hypothetical protein
MTYERLICDAAGYVSARDEARELRKLLWALIASNGPLVVDDCDLHAYDHTSALVERRDERNARTWFEVKR